MTVDHNLFGANAAQVPQRHKLVLKKPASWWGSPWREALPTGNGLLGAAVYGAVGQETVLLHHARLWTGGKKGELPDVSDSLAGIRQLLEEKNYREANGYLAGRLEAHGYESLRETPLPLADLKLIRTASAGFKHYRRALNMESGEVTVEWREGDAQFARALFVSRQDDCLVCELRAEGRAIDVQLQLTPHEKGASGPGFPPAMDATAEAQAAAGYIRYAAQNDDDCDFGAVLRAIPQGGEMEHRQGIISVCGAESVLIVLRVFTHGERIREWERLEAELARMAWSYDELLARHRALHSPLFLGADIRLHGEEGMPASNEEMLLEAYEGELPSGMAETLWAYGRYLFISGTHEEGLPFGLYGLWCGDYKAVWSHYMANENVQMMYWHAAVGGLTSLVPALLQYYEERMEQFRDNARKLYNCRGIFIPAGTTPGNAAPFQIVPVILHWTGAAGWLARHFYEYYQFTGDMDFLRKRALPFMREATVFYEDFLVLGPDGKYISYPSVSPENTPQNFIAEEGRFGQMAHAMPTAVNALLDFAILKELLTQLIEGSLAAGEDVADIAKWREMLTRIPVYEINADGAVKEWLHPDFTDRYRHRHISHIYPVFPAHEVTKASDPGLFRAFAGAVTQRLVTGIGDQTAWSFAHLANIYARLGDGDQALECLALLARSCLLPNYYTLHNDWRGMGISLSYGRAPVQMDANLGWVSAVQELLLYVTPDHVKVLPAVPKAWKKGVAEGLRFCSGSIAFSWDLELGWLEAELKADRPTDLLLTVPPALQWLTTEESAIAAAADRTNERRIRLGAGERLKLYASSETSGQ
ncbi:glycosyl hydrolase family 95 catalytic domain-containing protein [Paenibacillus sp. y28]|uniref:glycosyl hydrolase family 95 catalytic domain-containing protein n=1 Tax=Paenibacillus sp. y28 TaxID=3129110 RepID=UPI00301A50AE